ncbi:MAG: hypothetical protein HYS12_24935 [Planctomycetes bacterium]|nr:hypothetical protein [Planctomycetota bacterium]
MSPPVYSISVQGSGEPGKTQGSRRNLLGERHGQRFADPWEFVQFAEERRLGLDFTTPPSRPDLAPRRLDRNPEVSTALVDERSGSPF